MSERLRLIFAALIMLGSLQASAAPNIVVIMTDDQTLESLRVMTKTRALIGTAGTTFRNNYATFPLCCPSRATFLTGQYAHNHGVLDNRGGYNKLNHSNTLALWLQEAGYFTSHIGKYLNDYGLNDPTEVPPGWSHWQGLVDRTTYHMYGYTFNDNGTLITYGETEADYQTDVIADRTEATIDEAVAQQPFFLSIAPLAPHIEDGRTTYPNPRPAPRDLNAFSQEPLPRPPSFNEADVSDKPGFIRALPLLSASAIAQATAAYRSQLRSLLAVDDLVERVITKLSSAGVLDETVVIFTSDNGYFLGEHRLMLKKQPVYEEGTRVPLLIRGPGFPAGATANQFVANIDLAPTIVALAGATPRLAMDGRSLVPLAQNPGIGASRDLLIETLRYQAVRNRSFLYVEHATGVTELYDMRIGTDSYDPYQLQSRHADSTYSQIRSDLASKLNVLRTCSGSSCDTKPAGTCQGLAVTQSGTTGNNTINGTSGPDVIHGLGGNDTISGLGGDDVICGGKGADSINGGAGKDRLFGGPANDALSGGLEGDHLNGNAGQDRCDGGAPTRGDTAIACEVRRNVP